MKIHSPEFEKKLTAIVRTAALQNAAWSRIWGQRKKGWMSKLRGLLGVSLGPAFGVIVVGFVLGQAVSHEQLVAAIACYLLGSIFCLGGAIPSIVNCKDSDRFALDNFPIGDSRIFDFEWHGICVSARARCLTGFGMGLALLEFPPDTLLEWVGLFVFAGLYWRISLALGALIGAYVPPSLSTLTGMAFLTIPIGLGMYHGRPTGFLVPLLDPLVSVVNISFPTAWLAQFLGWFSDPEHSRNWIFAIPLLLVLIQLPRARRLLRSSCQYHEPASFVVIDEDESESALEHSAFAAKFTDADPALNISESVPAKLDRDFLQAIPLEQDFGRIERWIYSWFTPREKLLTEAFCELPLRLTANWVRYMKLLIIGALVIAALPPLGGWRIYPQLIVGALVLLSQIYLGDFNGRALSSARGNSQLVFHSGFPVRFAELQAMSLKATIVMSLAALLPLTIFVAYLSCSWGAGWLLEGPTPQTTFARITFGVETGIELALLILVYSPAVNASEYAERSTSNKRGFSGALFIATVAFPASVISILAAVAAIVTSSLWVTLATLTFGATCSFLVYRYYEKRLNGPRIDLIPSAKKS